MLGDLNEGHGRSGDTNGFIEVKGASDRSDSSLVSPILMWVLKNMLLDLWEEIFSLIATRYTPA